MKGQELVVITHNNYLATMRVDMLCDTLSVSGIPIAISNVRG